MTDNWKILAIDTSTSQMSVALLEGTTVRKQIDSLAERNHSIYLLPHIHDALQELGWRSADLQGIVVGLGPGSYTGVRIGVTVAKTMAWTLRIPVAGVSSLEAAAGCAWNESRGQLEGTQNGSDTDDGSGNQAAGTWIVPLVNARRGQAYTALFAANGGGAFPSAGWVRLKPDAIRLMDSWIQQLLERLKAASEQAGDASSTGEAKLPVRVVFAGETEGFLELIQRFEREAAENGTPVKVETREAYPGADGLGRLGFIRFAAGDSDDVHGLLPNYTQLAEAEANLLKKSTL